MQLMTALMIFNIASLEVSPPHGPTRHFTQGSHGIITITSHHLTPEVSPAIVLGHLPTFFRLSFFPFSLDCEPFYQDSGE